MMLILAVYKLLYTAKITYLFLFWLSMKKYYWPKRENYTLGLPLLFTVYISLEINYHLRFNAPI